MSKDFITMKSTCCVDRGYYVRSLCGRSLSVYMSEGSISGMHNHLDYFLSRDHWNSEVPNGANITSQEYMHVLSFLKKHLTGSMTVSSQNGKLRIVRRVCYCHRMGSWCQPFITLLCSQNTLGKWAQEPHSEEETNAQIQWGIQDF